MKMIKITTGNQISVHDFPDGSISEQTKLIALSDASANGYVRIQISKYQKADGVGAGVGA